LLVVLGKVLAALFHLQQQAGLPGQIRKRGSGAVLGLDPGLQRRAGFEYAVVPEGLEEPVQEDLRLALLVAMDVPTPPCDELLEARAAVGYRGIAGHGVDTGGCDGSSARGRPQTANLRSIVQALPVVVERR
jgi:hypothetical protein